MLLKTQRVQCSGASAPHLQKGGDEEDAGQIPGAVATENDEDERPKGKFAAEGKGTVSHDGLGLGF